MSDLQIVCDNCGARYRLPETFKSATATCKKCGTAIDVDRQRTGASAPEAAPAAARPAARAARPAAARAAAAAQPAHTGRPKHVRSPTEPLRETQNKNHMPLVIGGIVVVGIVVAIVLMKSGGTEPEPAKSHVAQAPDKPKPAAVPAASNVTGTPSDASAPKRPVADAAPAPIEPAAQDPQKPPTAKPATNGDKPAEKPKRVLSEATKEKIQDEREKLVLSDLEGWKKSQVKSLDTIFDVKKATQPFESAEISDADKTKLADLMQKAKDGGGAIPTVRALREMEKMGYPGLVHIINSLRDIDYKSTDDSMFAYQLNQTATTITLGVNTGFVPVEVGETMDPRKADWNARTVQQWLGGLKQQWPTKEKFDEYIAKRREKKDKEVELDPDDK